MAGNLKKAPLGCNAEDVKAWEQTSPAIRAAMAVYSVGKLSPQQILPQKPPMQFIRRKTLAVHSGSLCSHTPLHMHNHSCCSQWVPVRSYSLTHVQSQLPSMNYAEKICPPCCHSVHTDLSGLLSPCTSRWKDLEVCPDQTAVVPAHPSLSF